MRTLLILGLGALALLTLAAMRPLAPTGETWTAEERRVIASLRITALGPVPADPSNRVADDARAARLGERLFSDARLSANGAVSCASCHVPAQDFQDGMPRGRGVGTTSRRTPALLGSAWSPWQFWDGRKDSQWAQALGPLESAVEHGTNRAAVARVVTRHYREEYEAIFGPLPALARIPASAGPVADTAARRAWDALPAKDRDDITRVFVNAGKAIAAHERTLAPHANRFDRFADSLAAGGRSPSGVLSADERAGLRLFVGKAECVKCHNGPRFTDDDFHNIGVPAALGSRADRGRAEGAAGVLADEFNCRSRWSDATRGQCRELEFMVAEGPELEHAFKTPSLRGAATRMPYMHAGQFADLQEVIAHYDRAPRAPLGRSELRPLHLSATERRQLAAFLVALDDAPGATALAREGR
jgi:cytochrome c peroxidase